MSWDGKTLHIDLKLVLKLSLEIRHSGGLMVICNIVVRKVMVYTYTVSMLNSLLKWIHPLGCTNIPLHSARRNHVRKWYW